MALSISTLQNADRPRERLWLLGPAALTTAELLAILLGTGGKRAHVMELAERVLRVADGSLRRLTKRPSGEILQLEGIGPAKAARLMAALEIASRLIGEQRRP